MPKRALRSFRKGLEKIPNDVGLHFNIAVTLAGEDRDQEAIEHLESAIGIATRYVSALYLLAKLHRRAGHRIPSMLLFSRVIALEPNTNRSAAAAVAIWALLEPGLDHGDPCYAQLQVAETRGRRRVSDASEDEHPAGRNGPFLWKRYYD